MEAKAETPTKRGKYWKELTMKEKIERMRDIVKNLQTDRRRLQNKVACLRRETVHHKHKGGEVLIPMIDHAIDYPSSTLEKALGDEVYF